MLKWLSGAVTTYLFYSIGMSTINYYLLEGRIMAISKHSVVTFKKGNTLFIMADPSFKEDSLAYQYHIKNYALSKGVTSVRFLSDENFIGYRPLQGGRLLLHQQKLVFVGEYFPKGVYLDYILLSKPDPILETKISPQSTILLGGQIFGKRRLQMLNTIDSLKFRYYELDQGSLLL